jgi:hypothetical protein
MGGVLISDAGSAASSNESTDDGSDNVSCAAAEPATRLATKQNVRAPA